MKEKMKLEDEAALLWPLLTFAARNQEILSYARLDSLTGIAQQGLGEPLGLIYFYCEKKNLPALNSIVVKRDTGKPGIGYPGNLVEILFEQARVFVYDWKDQHTPVPRAADFRPFLPKLKRYSTI